MEWVRQIGKKNHSIWICEMRCTCVCVLWLILRGKSDRNLITRIQHGQIEMSLCVCVCADCGHFQRLLIFRFRNQRRKLERNMHVSLSHSSFYYKALQTPPFKLTHFALHFNHNTYDSSMDHRQFHRFMYASKVWIIRLFCAVTGIKPVGIH